MTDTDKIVAAVLTAAMLAPKNKAADEYVDTYESILAIIRGRAERARKKMGPVSEDALKKSSQKMTRRI
jgi:hypothetical protein